MRTDCAEHSPLTRSWWRSGALLGALAIVACSGADDRDGQDKSSVAVCDAAPVTECPTPASTYADVNLIFQERCMSCHSGEPDGPWPLDNYQHITDWWDVIRDDLLACSMPPSDSDVTLPDDERQRILVWIRCGFPK